MRLQAPPAKPDLEGVHVDRQDAKPQRPSLLAAAATRPIPVAPLGRILADMENRPATRRRVRLPFLAFGLATLAAASGWWLLNRPAADPAIDTRFVATQPAPSTPLAADTDPVLSSTVTAAPAAAIIVDGADAGNFPSVLPVRSEEAMTRTSAPNPFVEKPVAPATAAAAKAAGDQPGRHGKPAIAAAPNKARERVPVERRRDTVMAGGSQPDLLATLLGNIKSANRPEPGGTVATAGAPFATLQRPQRGSDQDALNALVRQVRDRDAAINATRVAAAGAYRNRGSAASTKAWAPSDQVQAQLRQCPRANTNAGLQCRQKVCATPAGQQDAACPRRQ